MIIQVHVCLILKKFTEYSLIGKISVLGIEAESSNLSTLIKKLYKKIMI